MSDTLAAKLQRNAIWHRATATSRKETAERYASAGDEFTANKYRIMEGGQIAMAETCEEAARIVAGAKTRRLAAGEPSEAFTIYFWKPYPGRRKCNKQGCIIIWNKMKLDAKAQLVGAGLERCKRSAEWKKENGEYIPAPERWLKRIGWEDEMTLHPSEHLNGNGAEPFGWGAFLKEHPHHAQTTHHYAQSFVRAEFEKWRAKS